RLLDVPYRDNKEGLRSPASTGKSLAHFQRAKCSRLCARTRAETGTQLDWRCRPNELRPRFWKVGPAVAASRRRRGLQRCLEECGKLLPGRLVCRLQRTRHIPILREKDWHVGQGVASRDRRCGPRFTGCRRPTL